MDDYEARCTEQLQISGVSWLLFSLLISSQEALFSTQLKLCREVEAKWKALRLKTALAVQLAAVSLRNSIVVFGGGVLGAKSIHVFNEKAEQEQDLQDDPHIPGGLQIAPFKKEQIVVALQSGFCLLTFDGYSNQFYEITRICQILQRASKQKTMTMKALSPIKRSPISFSLQLTHLQSMQSRFKIDTSEFQLDISHQEYVLAGGHTFPHKSLLESQ